MAGSGVGREAVRNVPIRYRQLISQETISQRRSIGPRRAIEPRPRRFQFHTFDLTQPSDLPALLIGARLCRGETTVTMLAVFSPPRHAAAPPIGSFVVGRRSPTIRPRMARRLPGSDHRESSHRQSTNPAPHSRSAGILLGPARRPRDLPRGVVDGSHAVAESRHPLRMRSRPAGADSAREPSWCGPPRSARTLSGFGSSPGTRAATALYRRLELPRRAPIGLDQAVAGTAPRKIDFLDQPTLLAGSRRQGGFIRQSVHAPHPGDSAIGPARSTAAARIRRLSPPFNARSARQTPGPAPCH